jgi:glycosyltransferase involved in cell wall biosynthesis
VGNRTIGVMARALDQGDGLGLYCRQLLQHLLTLDTRSRYVIFLASGQARGTFKEFANAREHVIPSRSKLVWDQLLVPLAAHRLNVDLLFNPKFSLPLLSGTPGVFVLQSCDWYVNPGNYPWWDNLYIRLMLPLYCRRARGVLAISRATLDQFVKHTKMKLPRAAITHAGTAPNFTAAADLEAQKRFRDEYGGPERFILTVARVLHTGHRGLPDYPGGNNERLLRAYRRYRRESPDPLPLLVAGRDVERYLRARGFTSVDLEGVRFLGFVPNDQLHAAYQLADCFVLATLYESFGLPILEALATGCPAIVPATGAGPEVAGAAARLIDPYDESDIARALLEVTASPALRERMRQEGVARARNFTWQRTAARVLEVFDEICPRAGAPAAMSAVKL